MFENQEKKTFKEVKKKEKYQESINFSEAKNKIRKDPCAGQHQFLKTNFHF